jgi:uncharacterized protein YkwD
MRWLIGRILVCLLVIGAGSALFMHYTGTTILPVPPAAIDVVEQQTSQLPEWTTGKIPAPGTITTSQEPVTLSTPLPAVAEGSGAVYPYPLSIPALEQQVHERINQQRIPYGLGSLSFDPALADIARKHSEDMAARHFFSHTNPAGQNATARGEAAGYFCRKTYGSYYIWGIAENLFQNNLYSAATFYSNRETVYHWNTMEDIAQVTVGGWMNSSGHRKNILTPTFNREGIGIAIASEKVYITENFC